MSRYIIIKINFPDRIENKDFSIRYILVDTIEARKIGKIIEEGTGEHFMNICIKPLKPTAKKEILSILESLGISKQVEIYYEDVEEDE